MSCMTGKPTYDSAWWQRLWSTTLREHADKVASRPVNAHLLTCAPDWPPGRALDAGCGHGVETLWLAARGWRVDALDFAAPALAHGRALAEAAGLDLAARIDWIEADLGRWVPKPHAYDLVLCLYVHIAGSVEEMVQRMAAGVAAGGSLLFVGHRPVDPATGAATAAAGQVQVSVPAVLSALAPEAWEIIVAEDRPRHVAGAGVDAVVLARRIK